MVKEGCSNPDCKSEHDDVLYLHAGCHPKSGLSLRYKKGSGLLIVSCAECEVDIAHVAVAFQEGR